MDLLEGVKVVLGFMLRSPESPIGLVLDLLYCTCLELVLWETNGKHKLFRGVQKPLDTCPNATSHRFLVP